MSLLLLFCILNSDLVKPPDSVLYWGQKLTINDFKATPDFKKSNSAESYVGFICNYSYDTDSGYFKFNVKSYFDPNRSWVKSHDSLTLIHEQIHFDIAELFARRLCSELSVIRLDFSIDERIEKVIEENKREMREYQDLYDSETIFSANFFEQRKWQEKMKVELIRFPRCSRVMNKN